MNHNQHSTPSHRLPLAQETPHPLNPMRLRPRISPNIKRPLHTPYLPLTRPELMSAIRISIQLARQARRERETLHRRSKSEAVIVFDGHGRAGVGAGAVRDGAVVGGATWDGGGEDGGEGGEGQEGGGDICGMHCWYCFVGIGVFIYFLDSGNLNDSMCIRGNVWCVWYVLFEMLAKKQRGI